MLISFPPSEPIPGGFLSAPSSPAHKQELALVVGFCLCSWREDLNAGAEFFNRKFSEAVPRPSASDGERLSRGKILSRAFL